MAVIQIARKPTWRIVVKIGMRNAEHCCLVKSAAAFMIPIAKSKIRWYIS